MAIFEPAGIEFLLRWGHFLAGVTWIGILYYFNFVQAEYFKEADPAARGDAFQKLVPRALWWFRWSAMFTFLTGATIYGMRGAGVSFDIVVGAVMGTLMFLNVWLIIWPKQKILIASATRVAEGGEALPEAAAAAPKAALASRTNTMFSLPMLFFMGASTHFPHGIIGSASKTALIIILVIIAALELNGVVGKPGPIATIRGVIIAGFVLTAVLYGVMASL